MFRSLGRRRQSSLMENPNLVARVTESNHSTQTNKRSSSSAAALKHGANHSSRVTNGEYKVSDEFEEDLEKYEEDGGGLECGKEDTHLPTQEELEFLRQRKRLKVTVRKQMNKELGTADPSSCDKTSAMHRKNYGSFFGSSQSVITSRAIQESKSLLEHPNLAARVPKSNQAIPVGSVRSIRVDFPKIYFRIETTNNIEKEMVMTSLFLPEEIIFEILSWLPVKSLLRFKCVSKMWCSIIQDNKFMDKHRHRTPCTMIYRNPFIIEKSLVTDDENFGAEEGEDADFCVVAYKRGVILEMRRTGTHRLRNPATRQVLDLPHIICPDLPRAVKYAGMCYIPATNDLKLVGLHHSKGKIDGLLDYSVIRVDTNLTWKHLNSPSVSSFRCCWPLTKVIGTIFYSIKLGFKGDHEIDCLDLENDKIINTVKIPHDFFLDWSDVFPVVWNSKLSLSRIEQDQLHVWVLEDCSKQKWADSMIIIPLTFLEFIENMSSKHIMPCMLIGNKLWLWFCRDHCYRTFFSFDIESEKVRFIRSRTRMKNAHLYRPSLCPFKGMRPYGGNT